MEVSSFTKGGYNAPGQINSISITISFGSPLDIGAGTVLIPTLDARLRIAKRF